MTLDLAALDPGIRETVRRLHDAGFRTTDSGDGVSKPDMACALAFPHVALTCDPAVLVAEARRFHAFLLATGVNVLPPSVGPDEGPWIQASYDPADNSATILLAGVDDRRWP